MASDARRVLILGGRPTLLESARSFGMRVTHIQRPGEFPLRYQELSDETLLADFTRVDDLLPVVRAWHAEHPFSQVFSPVEHGLIPAALIREALALGGNPVATTQVLRDKAAMRARLATSPLATVPFAECKDLTELEDFAQHSGYPIIIKPKDGIRSKSVYRVSCDMQVREAVDRIHEDGYDSFLAEKLIAGIELSAEAISSGGVHRLVSITEVFTDDTHMETGHVTPARITEAEATAVTSYVTRFLDLVGVVEGPTHTQLFLTADRGPVIIESHDRSGLDGEPELTLLTFGHDLTRLAFSVPAGLAELPGQLCWAPRQAAANWFVMGPAGRLASVSGTDAARSAPGVIAFRMAQEHRLIGRVCAASDYLGSVVTVGDSPDEAIERARGAAGLVGLEYA